MKIEEISTHGSFDTRKEAQDRARQLNMLMENDNLDYVVKMEKGKYVVALLSGFCDE